MVISLNLDFVIKKLERLIIIFDYLYSDKKTSKLHHQKIV